MVILSISITGFYLPTIQISTLFTGSMPPMPGMPGIPENITVTFISPTSVRVSWDTSIEHIEKYDVTYKPTDARCVSRFVSRSFAPPRVAHSTRNRTRIDLAIQNVDVAIDVRSSRSWYRNIDGGKHRCLFWCTKISVRWGGGNRFVRIKLGAITAPFTAFEFRIAVMWVMWVCNLYNWHYSFL